MVSSLLGLPPQALANIKKPQDSGESWVNLMAEDEGFDDQKSVAGALPGEQQPTGLLH